MEPFLYVLLAHVILDYPGQGEFLGLGKTQYNFLLLVHCIIWTLGHCAMADWLGIYQPWMLYWLFFGHIAMDWLKCHKLEGWCVKYIQPDDPMHWSNKSYVNMFTKKEVTIYTDSLGLPLWIDQAWHIVQIAVLVI